MFKFFNPITPKSILVTLLFPTIYFLLAAFIKLPLVDYYVVESMIGESGMPGTISAFALGVFPILTIMTFMIIFSKIKGFIFEVELSEKTIITSIFILTTIISFVQSLGISYYLESIKYYGETIQYVVDPSVNIWLFRIVTSLTLTSTVLLTLWSYFKLRNYFIINGLLLILIIGFFRIGGVSIIENRIDDIKNYFKDSKVITLKIDKEILSNTEALKDLDQNMKNFLLNEDKYFDYKRVDSNIIIKVKEDLTDKVKLILSQKHTLYFMGEDDNSITIAKELFENSINLPENIEKVESNYMIARTGEIILDYYFKSNSLKDLINFIPKLEINKAYKIFYEKRFYPEIYYRTYIFKLSSELSGLQIKEVKALVDTRTNSPYVAITFNERGKRIFGEITSKLQGHRIGIIIDGVVNGAPIVQDPILGGQASITPRAETYTEQVKEVNTLANILKSSMFTNFIKIIK